MWGPSSPTINIAYSADPKIIVRIRYVQELRLIRTDIRRDFMHSCSIHAVHFVPLYDGVEIQISRNDTGTLIVKDCMIE